METQFVCSACSCEHNDPADAALGHRVICLDCALTLEPAAERAATEPLAISAVQAIAA